MGYIKTGSKRLGRRGDSAGVRDPMQATGSHLATCGSWYARNKGENIPFWSGWGGSSDAAGFKLCMCVLRWMLGEALAVPGMVEGVQNRSIVVPGHRTWWIVGRWWMRAPMYGVVGAMNWDL
jgi:hypothetical protein